MAKTDGIVFFDCETRSKVDLRKHGLWVYATDPSTEIIVVSAEFPDGTSGVWAPVARRLGMDSGDSQLHDDSFVQKFNDYVKQGAPFVAWNSQFDRVIFKHCANKIGLKAPVLTQVLCAQTLAESYSLPGGLGKAADTLKTGVRKQSGAALISKFSDGNKPWPSEEPKNQAQLKAFWSYAYADIGSMRDVWKSCRPWTAQEWEDFHVIETTNDNGMEVDVDFAEKVVELAADEADSLNNELRRLTGISDITLAHSKRKLDWFFERVKGTYLEHLMWVHKTRIVEVDGRKVRRQVVAKSLAKSVQNSIKDAIDAADAKQLADTRVDYESILTFLDIIERGNGVASKKYGAMARTHVDGRIRAQFRCSPTITGRHASRGVQFDNVIRAKLPGDPEQTMAAILGCGAYSEIPWPERRKRLEQWFGLSIGDIFARLIRPTVIAEYDSYIVFGDWSAIEARLLPWLAKSEAGLRPYVEGRCAYSKAAAGIYPQYTAEDIYAGYKRGDPEMTYARLIGKIATLALGFGGGARALRSMALNYGVRMDLAQCEQIKNAWRNSNPWAKRFWNALDQAAWKAVRQGGIHRAGRIEYMKVGRDLWAKLPDGRPIVYPEIQSGSVFRADWDKEVETLTYRKKIGASVFRGELYGGLLAENVTQGAEASLLREATRRLHRKGYKIIGSTHDEIRLETRSSGTLRDTLEDTVKALKYEMNRVPDWANGLPIVAEIEYGEYYGK